MSEQLAAIHLAPTTRSAAPQAANAAITAATAVALIEEPEAAIAAATSEAAKARDFARGEIANEESVADGQEAVFAEEAAASRGTTVPPAAARCSIVTPSTIFRTVTRIPASAALAAIAARTCALALSISRICHRGEQAGIKGRTGATLPTL